jgi:ABC-type Zn uptake system ZnuABC Zn-binding protein ZnuA
MGGAVMLRRVMVWVWLVLVVCMPSASCGGEQGALDSGNAKSESVEVVTDTSFLADIVQNVAGDRLFAASIVPSGADPHSFEPTPRDAQRISEARAVVINAAGLMPTVDSLLESALGPGTILIEAAAGLLTGDDDPHCWLDPLCVIAYADNIAQGLALVDPAGEAAFQANAKDYAESLRELDTWILAQVETVPAERRLLVTNHESLGRFAARYGFKIVGTIFPNATGEGSPSARQLAALVESIRATGAPAIFLETGSNTVLAEQVAAETGVKVVTDLYTHSLGEGAATYLEMMRWNVNSIVEALR